MNTKLIILILVVAVVGLGIWTFVKQKNTYSQTSSQPVGHHDVYYCPMHPHYTSDKPGTCPICQMKLVKKEGNPKTELQKQVKKEKKILYWTDTMMPGYKSDHPGKSPMGMEMTPVYENDSQETTTAGYVSVTVPMQKQQLIGVRTAVVTKNSVVKTIRAAGRVAYDPDLYKAEVEYVEQYIAYLRLNRRLSKGSYTIQDAERKLKEAELDLVHMGASQQMIDQIRQDRFPDHSLLVNHGNGGQVFAEIFGSDLGFVDIGQKAKVEIPDFHETFDGVVQSIDPIVNSESRTTRVRIYVNTKRELKSNMFVRVSMPVELNEAIVVPREAIMDTGMRKVVFVQKDEGTFEPRDIQTGWETDEGFEVKSGLKEGERIVVSGNFLLDAESRVQAGLEDTKKASPMAPAEGDGHGQ